MSFKGPIKYKFNKAKSFEFKMDETLTNFFDNIAKKIVQDFDDKVAEFLTESGYELKRPYTEKRVLEIKEQLAKKDLYLDFLDILIYNDIENGLKCTKITIPFFNRISNPLTEKDKDILRERWIKENASKKSKGWL